MEVTRENLNDLLPEIENAISNATFISIDCEMTGINCGTDINAFDTQKQYYDKLRNNCKDFLVIQYGLATFRYDENTKKYKQKCFNFYIFPKPANRNVPDMRFICQASSIDFLASNGFDFNKLFKEGIPYLNSVDEAKYRDILNEKQKTRIQNLLSPQPNNNQNLIPIPDDDKPFIDNVFQQIEDFATSDLEELQLPKCNGFIRRLIYQEATQKLNNRVHLETKILENKDRVLVVSRTKSDQVKEEEEKQRVESEKIELENSIGFSRVMKLIVDSGKLVIGHNMFLDLAHSIDKFLTPLPKDYEEFKECAHCLFPRLLDTKFMSSLPPFKDIIASNVLGHLLNAISQEPFELPIVDIEENSSGYNMNDKKEHEAGYDAYITGISFIAMCNYLGKENKNSEAVLPNSKLLKPFVNRLFLMRLQDSPFVHLGGKDPSPPRDHVFHVTFPKEWKLNELVQLFSPFGSVYVAWLNESSAYVALHKRDQAKVALSTLSQSDTYSVITYHKRQMILNNLDGKKRLSSEEDLYKTSRRKRKKSSSIGEANSSRKGFEVLAEDEVDCGETISPDSVPSPPKKNKKKTFQESDWD